MSFLLCVWSLNLNPKTMDSLRSRGWMNPEMTSLTPLAAEAGSWPGPELAESQAPCVSLWGLGFLRAWLWGSKTELPGRRVKKCLAFPWPSFRSDSALFCHRLLLIRAIPEACLSPRREDLVSPSHWRSRWLLHKCVKWHVLLGDLRRIRSTTCPSSSVKLKFF